MQIFFFDGMLDGGRATEYPSMGVLKLRLPSPSCLLRFSLFASPLRSTVHRRWCHLYLSLYLSLDLFLIDGCSWLHHHHSAALCVSV